VKLKLPEAHWQVTAIGRAEISRCISAAPISAASRTGLEDTFYLSDGTG
jgi:uncharacterized protein (DUF849 family)